MKIKAIEGPEGAGPELEKRLAHRLAAVVDTELLAVHSSVHDALAGRVRGPVAAYLPGVWLPHCVLAVSRPADAFTALHPVEPVRARIVGVEVDPA